MHRARKKSPYSPRDGCEERNDVNVPLRADRFPLPRSGTDEQIDKRVDRVGLRQIDAALEGGLDQTTDDLRATDRLAVLQADVDC